MLAKNGLDNGVHFSQMQKEADYYMAQKILKQLLSAELISLDEFDKITELNRKKFSPVLAKIMP